MGIFTLSYGYRFTVRRLYVQTDLWRRLFFIGLFLFAFLALVSTTVNGDSPIVNPGFETGDFSGWSNYGSDTNVVFGSGHTGDYAAIVGGSWLQQDVDFTEYNVLSFWYQDCGGDSNANFCVNIDGNNVDYTDDNNAGSWKQHYILLSGYTGVHTVEIYTYDQVVYDDFDLAYVPTVEFTDPGYYTYEVPEGVTCILTSVFLGSCF